MNAASRIKAFLGGRLTVGNVGLRWAATKLGNHRHILLCGTKSHMAPYSSFSGNAWLR